jgi:hypothetical protein
MRAAVRNEVLFVSEVCVPSWLRYCLPCLLFCYQIWLSDRSFPVLLIWWYPFMDDLISLTSCNACNVFSIVLFAVNWLITVQLSVWAKFITSMKETVSFGAHQFVHSRHSTLQLCWVSYYCSLQFICITVLGQYIYVAKYSCCAIVVWNLNVAKFYSIFELSKFCSVFHLQKKIKKIKIIASLNYQIPTLVREAFLFSLSLVSLDSPD